MKRIVLLMFILLSANLAYGQQRSHDGHRATSVQGSTRGHGGSSTVRDHGSSSNRSHSSGSVSGRGSGTIRNHSHSGTGSHNGNHSGGAVRENHRSVGSGHSAGHVSHGGHGGHHAGSGNFHHGSGHGHHSVGHVRHSHSGRHIRPIRIRHHRIRPILHHEIVICINDRQPLWNGYHVRRYLDRVWICNAAGDRILQGDEIILLPNGYYKVRNGDFWRVYDERGESIFNVWGEDVQLLEDGVFQCYRAGMYLYYDELGNRLQ